MNKDSSQDLPGSCCSQKKASPPRWSRYRPLFVLVGIALLTAGAKQVHYTNWDVTHWDGGSAVRDFMGIFLLIFAMLKLFDVEGFADSFQKYDLLAAKSRGYAKLYPFLELGLALGYLSQWKPPLVLGATVILMSFGAAGVFRALRKGLDIRCACMGSSLNVPLSTVAVVENVGMVAMAGVMLVKIALGHPTS